ncbi:MAG: response regulator transcription factor [Rubrivivax sp.]|nr:response regulator transcription factor [Rubrivivax sp.]
MTAPAARALIAEDEPLLAAALRAELAALWPALEVVATVGDGDSAVAQALAQRPEVCFLDIRMPGSSGLEAARALAEDWPEGLPFPLIVFVTAYDQHALAAFEAQAVDYLVKPLDRPRLAACVERLRARLADRAAPAQLQRTLEQLRGLLGAAGAAAGPSPAAAAGAAAAPRLSVIPAQTGHLVQMVPVAEVLYFEAADKYVRVVTATREHLIRLSLRELLPQLDPAEFWQVHRGTVVRASAVASARREDSGKVTLTLRGRPETLTASRLYAHLFRGL